MKIYQLIIFTTLIIYILNSCFRTTEIHKDKDCTIRVFDVAEKILGMKYCCYLYGVSEIEEIKRCVALTEAQYDNIEETIKTYEEMYEFHVKDLTCG